MTPALTIITAIVGSSAVAGLIQFLISRNDNRDEWRASIVAKIDQLTRDLNDDRETRKRENADDARRHILAASDAVRHGERHSKEWWDQLNEDISSYDKYCDTHPDYKNNRAVQAIANLNRVYADRLLKNDFI